MNVIDNEFLNLNKHMLNAFLQIISEANLHFF